MILECIQTNLMNLLCGTHLDVRKFVGNFKSDYKKDQFSCMKRRILNSIDL